VRYVQETNHIALRRLVIIWGAAYGETDVLLRAVGFALTGSDDTDPKVIDRANCVFAIDKGTEYDVFHLNNVQTDRITIRIWEQPRIDPRAVVVELHGDEVVVDETFTPKEEQDELTRQLLNALKPRHDKQTELSLGHADMDRVKRAWQYIYSHGCTGKQSPF
jgi:hypothetical protein